MGCKVCELPDAVRVMQKVYKGEITYPKAAKMLKVPTATVWNCFTKHWALTSNGEKVKMKLKEAQTVDDYIDILKDQLDLIITRLSTINDRNFPIEIANERAIVALTKELRGIMRDILEFEGKLTTGIHIQYNQLNLKFNTLTSFLFSSLCEKDRAKLLEKLPELTQKS